LAGLRRRGLASRQRPLVILAQEAYRADATVPPQPGSKHHGGKGRGGARMSIVDIAQRERLSLRYAPSMRNGVHASDRGNAVLSTVAIGTAHAFLLTYVRQRRVVITAGIAGLVDMGLRSANVDTDERFRFSIR